MSMSSAAMNPRIPGEPRDPAVARGPGNRIRSSSVDVPQLISRIAVIDGGDYRNIPNLLATRLSIWLAANAAATVHFGAIL